MKEINYTTIQVIPGSLIITPKEIEAFNKLGIDLSVMLNQIQQEIYRS